MACGERRDLPPSSLTRNQGSGSEPRDASETTSNRRGFTVNKNAGSSSSIEQGNRWDEPLSTSPHELDQITSSIYDERDILDEILGYDEAAVTHHHEMVARLASCEAYDVVALPATECIDGPFDHTSDLISCLDPRNTLLANVSRESREEPNWNCSSCISEVIPYPGRTTGRFEQFMDFFAFPEHHFSFDATKYTQSLRKVSDCIAFPERYLRLDDKLKQARFDPAKTHLAKNGRVEGEKLLGKDGQPGEQKMKGHDFLDEVFEDVQSGSHSSPSPSSKDPRLETRGDKVDYACCGDEGVFNRDSSSPMPCQTDQTSDSLSSGVTRPCLERPIAVMDETSRNSTGKNEIDHGSSHLDGTARVEEDYRSLGTHLVRNTRTLLSDTTSESTHSNNSNSDMKRSDLSSTEMGMELVIVSKTIGHRTKKEKNLVQRFFGAVHRSSPERYL